MWLQKSNFILLLIFMLAGCGFHLQEEIRLASALDPVMLQAPDPYGQLARSLKEYLQVANVHVVSDPQQANLVIAILRDDTTQDLISMSSSQQTRQYNLKVHVVFEIRTMRGTVLVPPQYLSESRVITVQSNTVLGSSNEADLYYQQMRRSIAYLILNRLASPQIARQVTQKESLRNEN